MTFSKVATLTLGILGVCAVYFAMWKAGGLLAGLMARKKRARVKLRDSEFPMSAFSMADHPAAISRGKAYDPLAEAEIYVIYGKANEAKVILEQAKAKQLVTQEAIDAFWARYPECGM